MAQESRTENAVDSLPSDVNGNGHGVTKSKSLFSRLKVILPVVIVLAAISLVAWRWYLGTKGFVSTDDAFVEADRVSISSKILGRIIQLNADEGDSVRAGQVLVTLDASDLHAQHAQSQTALNLAQGNVKLAKVSLDKAEQDFRRSQAQFKENVVPAEQLEHAQKEYEASQARYAIAQAQVEAARAQISVIDTSLKNTSIISPMDGVVSRRWVLPGDIAQAGQPILTVYNLRDVWITANLEETKLHELRIGDSVDVRVDAYPDKHFNGKVSQFGSNTAAQFSLIPPNNASGNFTKVTQRVPVKIQLEPLTNAGIRLLPGMSAEVKVRVHAE
jgi:membrane fusion protein (multidrug efflux system)